MKQLEEIKIEFEKKYGLVTSDATSLKYVSPKEMWEWIEQALEEVENVLDEIKGLSDHQIPYYAYGDNEAGVELSTRLNEIHNISTQCLSQLKGE